MNEDMRIVGGCRVRYRILGGCWIEGLPKATPRIRRSVRGGVYTPRTADSWKADIAAQLSGVAKGEPGEMFEIVLVYHLPRPQRWMRKKHPEGPIPCDVKPDLDNLDKAVLDAITQKGCVWRDDAQVFHKDTMKFYHAKTGTPGLHITIWGVSIDGISDD